jgi:hypothetical protein
VRERDRLRRRTPGARGSSRAGVDTILYAVSALFALVTLVAAAIPQYREWGRMAVVPYGVAAAIALVLARRRSGVPVRTWLAIAVLIGAALAPMALEATLRSDQGMGLHAQSEVIVTEEAAKALLDGRDPYAAVYLHGPLVARPLPTKTHFPYLPGMIAFGLPRAIGGGSPVADARVWFALATLAAAAGALLPRRHTAMDPNDRLRAFQILAVLPTGALLMATGGDDLPVLALMLMALVLADDRRPTGAGLAAGAAAAMKPTSWILIPFMIVSIPAGRARRRTCVAIAAVFIPVVVPFVLWRPAAFVEDAIRFPLGLGTARSAAGTPTLGSALIAAFPGAKLPLTLLFVAIVVGVALILLIRRPPASAGEAALAAAIVFAVAVLLAPSARAGYLVYPIDLFVWSIGLRRSRPVDSLAHEEAGT